MRKILLLMSIGLLGVFAQARDYTDKLIVTINEESTPPQASTISVEEQQDGTYNLSLKNFQLIAEGDTLPVGNINLTGIEVISNPETSIKTFTFNQTITIAPGGEPADAEWLGPMLGEVPIALTGEMTDDKLYCIIDIDMMESLTQVIRVTFGSPIPVSSKAYTDNLVVTINEESTSPQPSTIFVDLMKDGTYNLFLRNFQLSDGEDTLPVGNINLTGIEMISNPEIGVKTFAFNQTITIAPGDEPADAEWLGPMLGEVPIALTGEMTDDKLYCIIDIDMMESLQQVIRVTFGSVVTGIENTTASQGNVDVYTFNGIAVRKNVEQGAALKGLQKGIYIVNGKKTINN